MGLTSHGSKIFRIYICIKHVQTFCSCHYSLIQSNNKLLSMVLGTKNTGNLSSKLHGNFMPLYVRDLNINGFCNL